VVLIASDLPETFSSPGAMARALSSYIADPFAVRRHVLDRFHSAPDIKTIRRLRAEHLRPLTPEEPLHPHEGYWPGEESERLVATNCEFVALLERERKLSKAITPVDRALEREVAAARAATC
jgi:hypothetical protein